MKTQSTIGSMMRQCRRLLGMEDDNGVYDDRGEVRALGPHTQQEFEQAVRNMNDDDMIRFVLSFNSNRLLTLMIAEVSYIVDVARHHRDHGGDGTMFVQTGFVLKQATEEAQMESDLATLVQKFSVDCFFDQHLQDLHQLLDPLAEEGATSKASALGRELPGFVHRERLDRRATESAAVCGWAPS